ncbi:hypothetical protein J4219_09340 [Candidatus Woesearchaeota archaeon]|nr:hypothetical protein [Candidatus Woesearchaeota archaeon]
MDDRLRRLERLAMTSSVWSDVLRWRGELKMQGMVRRWLRCVVCARVMMVCILLREELLVL